MRRRWRVALSSLGALGLVLAGCSPNDPQDSPCNQTSDCQSGLDCVAPTTSPADAGSCTTLDKRCSKACTMDTDCAHTNLGTCSLTTCGGARYCMGNL